MHFHIYSGSMINQMKIYLLIYILTFYFLREFFLKLLYYVVLYILIFFNIKKNLIDNDLFGFIWIFVLNIFPFNP